MCFRAVPCRFPYRAVPYRSRLRSAIFLTLAMGDYMFKTQLIFFFLWTVKSVG